MKKLTPARRAILEAIQAGQKFSNRQWRCAATMKDEGLIGFVPGPVVDGVIMEGSYFVTEAGFAALKS